MIHWPNHHATCFCWVERGQKQGHPSDICHCGNCMRELWKKPKQRMSVSVADYDKVVPVIVQLQTAGYTVVPIGEFKSEVTIDVEDDAVEMWKELTAGISSGQAVGRRKGAAKCEE